MKTKTWEDEDYTYTVSDHDKQITGNGWEQCLREKQWVPIGRIFSAGLVYRKKKLKVRIPTVADIRASGHELKRQMNYSDGITR